MAATSDSPMCRTTARPGVSVSTSQPSLVRTSVITCSWRVVCSRYFCHSLRRSSFTAQSMAVVYTSMPPRSVSSPWYSSSTSWSLFTLPPRVVAVAPFVPVGVPAPNAARTGARCDVWAAPPSGYCDTPPSTGGSRCPPSPHTSRTRSNTKPSRTRGCQRSAPPRSPTHPTPPSTVARRRTAAVASRTKAARLPSTRPPDARAAKPAAAKS